MGFLDVNKKGLEKQLQMGVKKHKDLCPTESNNPYKINFSYAFGRNTEREQSPTGYNYIDENGNDVKSVFIIENAPTYAIFRYNPEIRTANSENNPGGNWLFNYTWNQLDWQSGF